MKGRIIRVLSLAFLVFLGLAVAFFYSVKAGFFGPLPGKEALADLQQESASMVFSADGKLIGKIYALNRSEASFEQFPEHLVKALIATEDVRFYEHSGVDYKALLRVLVRSIIMQDKGGGGGSTITQQLAKNLFGRRDFSLISLPVNKVKEIILAHRLESIYSKDQILELYLNTVSFSENTYGVKAGAQRFFSKNPQQLQVNESAVLVGLLKANTFYNPRLNPENARLRRNVVLAQMQKYQFLSAQEADSLQALPLKIDYQNLEVEGLAEYFKKQVEQQAREILKDKYDENGEPFSLETAGLQITTTLDADLQKAVQTSLQNHLGKLQVHFNRQWNREAFKRKNPELVKNLVENSADYKRLKAKKGSSDSLSAWVNEKKNWQVFYPGGDTVIEASLEEKVLYEASLLRSGAFGLDPETGAVKTWVGGRSYRWMPYDHVLSERQAASTFKPIVFAAALEHGMEPCDFQDAERRIYEQFDNWAPRNYDDQYEGMYSMQGALKKSVNTVTVKTLLEVGVKKVIAFSEQLGITSDFPENPSLALGSGSVSLKELTTAYAVFANGGRLPQPYLIEEIKTKSGETIYKYKAAKPKQVMNEQNAALMNAMLQGVVNEGTGSSLRKRYSLKSELAGKTGTSQNYSDGWFIGYNPALVLGIWTGGSSPAFRFSSGAFGSGSTMALPIFGETWQEIEQRPEMSKYARESFPPLSEKEKNLLDCEDYREEGFLDKVKGIFSPDKGEKFKNEEDKEDKPSFFERLFKKDK